MLTAESLQKGASEEADFVVSADKTANYFSEAIDEKYAEVLGTPFLIADMERVCANLMKPLLSEDEVSVGAHINIRHVASTGVGATYSIKAIFEGSRFGLYTFDVEAHDGVGVIGKGQIVRAIGNHHDIVERANQAINQLIKEGE